MGPPTVTLGFVSPDEKQASVLCHWDFCRWEGVAHLSACDPRQDVRRLERKSWPAATRKASAREVWSGKQGGALSGGCAKAGSYRSRLENNRAMSKVFLNC